MLCYGLVLLQLAAWNMQWQTNLAEIDRLRADQREERAKHNDERRHKERIDLRRKQATGSPSGSCRWGSALGCGDVRHSVQPAAAHAAPVNCSEDSTVSAPQRASFPCTADTLIRSHRSCRSD